MLVLEPRRLYRIQGPRSWNLGWNILELERMEIQRVVDQGMAEPILVDLLEDRSDVVGTLAFGRKIEEQQLSVGCERRPRMDRGVDDGKRVQW